MPVYLQFRGWSGKDVKAAAGHLTGVLKLEHQKSMTVLEWLVQGRTWKFPTAIADRQAQQAYDYFQKQGFQLDLLKVEPPPAPAPPPPQPASVEAAPPPDGRGIPLGFHGTLRELAPIYITNGLMVAFSLGLMYCYAKTRVREYLWGQTSFGPDRLAYHGTWKELFFAWIKLVGVIVLILLVGQGLFLMNPILGSLFDSLLGIVLLLGFPALMVGAMRYRLSRSSWRGIRFSFRGTRWEAVLLHFSGMVLMSLTFGLMFPWYFTKMTHFWRNNSWFGNLQFRFDGIWNDWFQDFFILWLAFPLFMVAGLLHPVISLIVLLAAMGYGLWFWARLQRYIWDHTQVGKGTFNFSASAKDYAGLFSGNSLIRLLPLAGIILTGWHVFKMVQTGPSSGGWVLLTLLVLLTVGLFTLARAWITCRNLAFRARHLTLTGPVHLDQVEQEIKESGAFSDDALDWFDVPMDVI